MCSYLIAVWHPLWRCLGCCPWATHSACSPGVLSCAVPKLSSCWVAGAVGDWPPVRRVTFISQPGSSGSTHAFLVSLCPVQMAGVRVTTDTPFSSWCSSGGAYLEFSSGFFISFYGRRSCRVTLHPSLRPCTSLFCFTFRCTSVCLSLHNHWLTFDPGVYLSLLPCHTACPFTPWPALHFSRSLVACWPLEYVPIICIAYMCERQLYREMQMGRQVVQLCTSLGNGAGEELENRGVCSKYISWELLNISLSQNG